MPRRKVFFGRRSEGHVTVAAPSPEGGLRAHDVSAFTRRPRPLTAEQREKKRETSRAWYHEHQHAYKKLVPRSTLRLVASALPCHQVIRTFAPPLAGTIALSFFAHRGYR